MEIFRWKAPSSFVGLRRHLPSYHNAFLAPPGGRNRETGEKSRENEKWLKPARISAREIFSISPPSLSLLPRPLPSPSFPRSALARYFCGLRDIFEDEHARGSANGNTLPRILAVSPFISSSTSGCRLRAVVFTTVNVGRLTASAKSLPPGGRMDTAERIREGLLLLLPLFLPRPRSLASATRDIMCVKYRSFPTGVTLALLENTFHPYEEGAAIHACPRPGEVFSLPFSVFFFFFFVRRGWFTFLSRLVN